MDGPRTPNLVVFAHVPPPAHGQAKMVEAMLKGLKIHHSCLTIRHIDARFSSNHEQIGSLGLSKGFALIGYIVEAIKYADRSSPQLFYYVPGPVKWSAVVRDWFVLAILRPFYPKRVFHWHAIGQGEWSAGSTRLKLPGPMPLDLLARRLSKLALSESYLSICVASTSTADASAIASSKMVVVPNGITDPCPDFDTSILPKRRSRSVEAAAATNGTEFRILFLSYITLEKGIFEALGAVDEILSSPAFQSSIRLSLAGEVDSTIQDQLDQQLQQLRNRHSNRLSVELLGYVEGSRKRECFENHDLLLTTSRWESFGLTTLEAMAHGLPVVAVLSDGVRGVLPENYPFAAEVGDTLALSTSLASGCKYIQSGCSLDLSLTLRERFLSNFSERSFSNEISSVLVENASAPNLKSRTSRGTMKLGRFARAASAVLGSTIRDAETGAVLGKAFIFTWRSKIHLIGYTGMVPLRPIAIPMKTLFYWKMSIGFTGPREPDYPKIR